MSFPKFVMTKNTPVFPILHVFAPLNDVHCLVLKNNPNKITWIFYADNIYPTSNTSGPPPGFGPRDLCVNQNIPHNSWIYILKAPNGMPHRLTIQRLVHKLVVWTEFIFTILRAWTLLARCTRCPFSFSMEHCPAERSISQCRLVRQIKLRIQALINILIFTDRCSF